MIDIIKIGRTGITKDIDILIKYIEENSNEIISVARINDNDDNYSFIALFKDKCTIGKYSALINEWGTNDGMSGEGGSGYIRMNNFLNKNHIKVFNMNLSNTDAKKIGYGFNKELTEWNDIVLIWKSYTYKLLQKSENL